MTQKIKLSPSRINTFLDCKRCFWLKINKGIDRPREGFPSLPSGIDKVVKERFDKYREENRLPPELEQVEENVRLLEDDVFLRKCRNWRSRPKYIDKDLGVVLRGGVDDLLKDKENDKITVLDYKTKGYQPDGSVPEYYEMQLNLYSLMLAANDYDVSDHAYLLYYHPEEMNDDGNFVFDATVKKVPVSIERAKTTVKKAKTVLDKSVPSASDDCEFCEWNQKHQ